MIAPPVSAPAHRGMPVRMFKMVAPAISWPASSASDPMPTSAVATPRTVGP